LTVHFVLVDVYGILHCDISINNILMFICTTQWVATSDDQQKQKDVIAHKKFQHGLLINFNYSDMLNVGQPGASSGDCTVSVHPIFQSTFV